MCKFEFYTLFDKRDYLFDKRLKHFIILFFKELYCFWTDLTKRKGRDKHQYKNIRFVRKTIFDFIFYRC